MTSRKLGLAVITASVVILLLSTAASAQHLFFNPSVSIPINITFQIDLDLTTDSLPVQGLDIVFTFDPAIVQLDAINAGSWFTGSGLDYYLWIDPLSAPGVVHATMALLGAGSTVDGTILNLSFTALDAGISPLHFLAMSLRDDANAPLSLSTHSTGDQIVIEEAIPNEEWSVSKTKLQWR